MGKGSSRKKNKNKVPERQCPCLLFPGENSSPLVAYLAGLGADVMSQEQPCGELQLAPRNAPAMLVPAAQDILFRVIHVVVRELEAGYYFKRISETNFVITDSHIIKIKVNVTEEVTTPDQRSGTIHKLRYMIDRVLIETSDLYKLDRSVNPEMSHLLGLMRDYQDGRSTLFLIKYHFSLLPISNRGPAYIRLYDHTLDVLRFNDPVAYMLVVEGVEIPVDWDHSLLTNQHLADSLRRGDYDLHATRFPSILEPQLLPLRYLRNRPSHAQEGAACALSPRGVKFTASDLARALYIRLPFAFVSFQKSLHFVGELENIDGLVDLFPGRLTIPRIR